VGEWLHSHTPLKVKKHGRREKSLFRYGLDHLRSVVNDLDIKHRQFLECLQFLSLYLGKTCEILKLSSLGVFVNYVSGSFFHSSNRHNSG
jgi:hypothetical protein